MSEKTSLTIFRMNGLPFKHVEVDHDGVISESSHAITEEEFEAFKTAGVPVTENPYPLLRGM